MTRMHNRRGSVLLMAIGMLTILAILTSTFLIISNLDSEETESLSVRAYAEPIVDGLLAKAVAQISFDRQVTAAGGPYAAMLTDSTGLGSFMEYPHAYTTAETADHWLSSSYVPGEGISGPGQLTNLQGPANVNAYKIDPVNNNVFAETTTPDATFPKGYDTASNPSYVDTDCDGIPDAVLYDTGISSPLSDANTYYAGVRIEDLSSRMCINTAGGWDTTESQYDRPVGSGPEMIDLRTFLDKRSGTSSSTALYPLLNAGDTSNKGRIGDASPATGGTVVNPAPASTKGYYRYCGAYLLSPGKPASGTGGYQPFGIGDEVFFLNACSYIDNTSQFGGRINQIILPLCNATNTPLPDNIRRQFTTMSCVSSLVRWPDPANNFIQPLVIGTVRSAADCQLVYERMKLMLKATGIGKTDDDKTSMAAHFAANLWAYSANGTTGEPWKFTTGGIDFYGLRQDLVITQVFARHISNSKYDANDPSKDDSAWGYALEVSNPTAESRTLSDYEFEIKSQNGNTVVVPLQGDGSSIAASAAAATTPTKRVVYNYGFGPARTAMTTAQLFGETPDSAKWYLHNKSGELDFRKSTASLSITLYRKVNGERVPIDFVTVGNGNSYDLPYDTSLQPADVSGKYPTKNWVPAAGNPYVYIRRDDYMKNPAGTRLARFNLAMYKCDGPTQTTAPHTITGTKLGLDNAIAQPPDFNRCTYRTPISGIYSPGIYRPRHVMVTTTPSARESMPTDDYFLPSLADLDNIYLTGPSRQGAVEKTFTTAILLATRSVLFTDRADTGRMPTVNKAAPDVAGSDQANGKYPDIPQGFLFHEFFTRTPPHQARDKETKRLYGTVNINTLPIQQNVTYNSVARWLPWPKIIQTSPYNRLALGQGGAAYVLLGTDGAIAYIRKYRDESTRATKGFFTPGEVGIPLASYVDEKLMGATAGGTPPDAKLQDADYVRARNCLFSYISDCISTRSDVYACYITVQHGRNYSGKRWRYVAVIDRSNVLLPTDKAAVLLVSQLR